MFLHFLLCCCTHIASVVHTASFRDPMPTILCSYRDGRCDDRASDLGEWLAFMLRDPFIFPSSHILEHGTIFLSGTIGAAGSRLAFSCFCTRNPFTAKAGSFVEDDNQLQFYNLFGYRLYPYPLGSLHCNLGRCSLHVSWASYVSIQSVSCKWQLMALFWGNSNNMDHYPQLYSWSMTLTHLMVLTW